MDNPFLTGTDMDDLFVVNDDLGDDDVSDDIIDDLFDISDDLSVELSIELSLCVYVSDEFTSDKVVSVSDETGFLNVSSEFAFDENEPLGVINGVLVRLVFGDESVDVII